MFDEKGAHWTVVSRALVYYRHQAVERAQEGLKSLADQQGLKLDGQILEAARQLVSAGAEFDKLERVVDAIISDISMDRATLTQYADGPSIIGRKKNLFEDIRPGMKVTM